MHRKKYIVKATLDKAASIPMNEVSGLGAKNRERELERKQLNARTL